MFGMAGAMMPNPMVNVGDLEDLTSTVTVVNGATSSLKDRIDAIRGMAVSPDGKKMILVGRNDKAHSNGVTNLDDNRTVYAQMTMNPPFDTTTLALDTSVGGIDSEGGAIEDGFWNPRNSNQRPEGMWINPEGTKALLGMHSDLIHMYNISNFNLPTTAISPTSTFTDSSTQHRGYSMKPDGTKLFIYSHDDIISQFDLTTAFDLSTVTNRQSVYLGSGTKTSPHGLGTLTGKDVFETNSPQGGDMFISQYDGKTVWIAVRQSVTEGVLFTNNDPVTAESAETANYGTVIECSLSTAYDITTLSAVTSSVSGAKTMFTFSRARNHLFWVNEQRKAKKINASLSDASVYYKRSWV